MPKKTKREKLLADERRLRPTAHVIAPTPTIVPGDNIPPITSSFSFRYKGNSPLHGAPQTILDTASSVFIRKDLGKTILLSAVAIGVELIIALRWK